MKKNFSTKESESIVKKLGAKLSPKGIKQFKKGLGVELEHGTDGLKEGMNTNVTNNDPIKTGKIALAHLKEAPSYYTALKNMEKKEKKKGGLKVIISKQLKK